MRLSPRIICGVMTMSVVCAAAPPSSRDRDDVVADPSTVDAGAKSLFGRGFELRGEAANMDTCTLTGGGFSLNGGMAALDESQLEDVLPRAFSALVHERFADDALSDDEIETDSDDQ